MCTDGDGRVLLCRNHRGERELPGGRPERGERFGDTLAREMREETGLAVTVGRLLGVLVFEPVPGRWVDIVGFEVDLDDPYATPAASEEHTQVAFCGLESIELPHVYRELISRSGRGGGRP